MVHGFWIVPLVLLIAFLASPRFRGEIAETRVRRILSAGLEKNRYTVLNDVTVPSGGGTVHIDHVVVSRFGVFVIESQHARGWVSGGEFQERWKQYRWGRFTRMENPLHKNSLQVEALLNILKVPAKAIHPVLVLLGHRGFRTVMPARVVAPEKLLAYMRKKAQPLLDEEQAARILKMIESARVQPFGGAAIHKWRWLQVALLVVLFAGTYFAFRDEVSGLVETLGERNAEKAAPELFHPDGSRKTKQEIREASLICAFSQDSGRCSCYEPGGPKVDIDPAKCRSLAERGSILKQ